MFMIIPKHSHITHSDGNEPHHREPHCLRSPRARRILAPIRLTIPLRTAKKQRRASDTLTLGDPQGVCVCVIELAPQIASSRLATRTYRYTDKMIVANFTIVLAAASACRGCAICEWRTIHKIRPRPLQMLYLLIQQTYRDRNLNQCPRNPKQLLRAGPTKWRYLYITTQMHWVPYIILVPN